jgi:serine/threonine-protein kinase
MSAAADVRAQLARILASPQFAHADRLSRFLRLAVQVAASGRQETLKEYRIGVEVFDRGDGFDPRVDPIVRVQATKLRSKLAEYYADGGVDDPLVITMPKGGYVADIRHRPSRTEPQREPLPSAARTRIAVLPFVNMSPDRDNEYFSDGLTEELINRLAAVPSLRVVARTSAFRFKGRNEDLRTVGAQLDVGTVIEGSVRRDGDHVRVTVQVIDVATGFHLFSRTYDRELAGVFGLQDELAQAVVDEVMRDTASADVQHDVGKALTTSVDTYHVYLRGMYALSNRFEGLPQAVALLRQAVVADPRYAPAWAGLAYTYWTLAWFFLMRWQEALPLARDAAQRTLDLDPQSAFGHASLGIVQCGFQWDWAAGEASFRRAIELNPGLAIAYPFFAFTCLLPQRRTAEACANVERALSLDPFNPLFHGIAIVVLAHADRCDDALRQFALGQEVDPRFAPILGSGGIALERLGRIDEAIATYRRLCELTQDRPAPLSLLGHALAASGARDEAERLATRILASGGPWYLDAARVYAGLRDAPRTLDMLEAALRERDIHLLTLPTDRRFDWLRAQPRFEAVLLGMHLPADA